MAWMAGGDELRMEKNKTKGKRKDGEAIWHGRVLSGPLVAISILTFGSNKQPPAYASSSWGESHTPPPSTQSFDSIPSVPPCSTIASPVGLIP